MGAISDLSHSFANHAINTLQLRLVCLLDPPLDVPPDVFEYAVRVLQQTVQIFSSFIFLQCRVVPSDHPRIECLVHELSLLLPIGTEPLEAGIVLQAFMTG